MMWSMTYGHITGLLPWEAPIAIFFFLSCMVSSVVGVDFRTLAICLVLHYSSSCTLIAQQQGLHLTTKLKCVVTLWCRCGSCNKGSPSCSSHQAGTCQGKE